MNELKRLERLKVLLVRLKNNDEVTNRDLKLVLSSADFQEMQDYWKSIKSEKTAKKPKEVKRYEQMLKRATLFENRYETYQAKFGKKREIEKEFVNRTEHELEKALEYFIEITTGSDLISWFDRRIDPNKNLALENMPRTNTSKSYHCEASPAFSKIKIRDVKIDAVEKAIDQIESPSNTKLVNDGLDEAKESIAKLNSLKRRKIDFNF